MTSMFKTVRDGRGFDVLLVVLALAYLLVFSAFPIIYNVVMSFQTVDIFTLATLQRPFVGFANYRDVLSRPLAVHILWNTIQFVGLSLFFQVTFGFGLAMYFRMEFPGASWLRGIFLVGRIMPALAVGAVWKWILAGDFGVLNAILLDLGVIRNHIFWMSDPAYALYAIIIANIWLGIPFNMILLSVGLAAIPTDIYEAAALDGAGPMRRFFTMTLPLMRSTLGAVICLGLIFTLQQFDLVAIMTHGGPSNASNVAQYWSQYWSWQMSFETYDISLGSVVATLMIAVVVVIAAFYVRSTRHEHTW